MAYFHRTHEVIELQPTTSPAPLNFHREDIEADIQVGDGKWRISAQELKELLAERDAARVLREEQGALRGALRLVTAERDLAEERLRACRRELFGAKSEARDSDQPGLFNEAEVLRASSAPAQEGTPESPVTAHTRKRRGNRKPLDPDLPRELVRHELPEAERFCADDGHALVEIGAKISEQIDVVSEQLRVLQHQRVKYAYPHCDLGIKLTPAPPRIIPRVPFVVSAPIVAVATWIRPGMTETPVFKELKNTRRLSDSPLRDALSSKSSWKAILNIWSAGRHVGLNVAARQGSEGAIE